MKLVLRMIKMIKPFPALLVMSVLLMLAGTAADFISPLFLKEILDVGIMGKNLSYVGVMVLSLAVVSILKSIAYFFQGYFTEAVGQKFAYRFRNQLYSHLQSLSFSFFDKHHTGQIMARMTGDIETIRNFLGFAFINLIFCVLNFSVGLILFFVISWKLALIVVIPTPILVITMMVFEKKVDPVWKEIREQVGKLTTTIQENISGIRVVKAFSREIFEKTKFDGKNLSVLKENLKRAGIEASAFPFIDLLSGMIYLLLIVSGGFFVVSGEITLGMFTAMQWYVFVLIWPIRFAGWLINNALHAKAAAPRVFEIIDAVPDIKDKPNALEIPRGKGSIEFKGIDYTFADGQAALKDINLTINPGEMIAVIGGTGSGKSTLMGLIPRFYDPTSGNVLIDGYDVRDVGLTSLRSNIGIVMQDTFLFSATLRENLSYGKPEATDDEIEKAARIAHIHDFIDGLPDGYDTRIGERGIGLSGGQKQRVALARAVLTDPEILLLDEPTSNVDTATEKSIQASLGEVMRGRTTLVIAQRLSTIKMADRIVVLDSGRIVEIGTHQELLSSGGYYSRIYDLQFKGQELHDAVNN